MKQLVLSPNIFLSTVSGHAKGEEVTVRGGKIRWFMHVDEVTDGMHLGVSFIISHIREICKL